MRLIGSLIVRNEMGRLMEPCVESLASYCDELRVLDDCSDDGTYEWLAEYGDPLRVKRLDEPLFRENEGMARQIGFEWVLEGEPTHVLALDADEFISDGLWLREFAEALPHMRAYMPLVNEVWRATPERLEIRTDRRWQPFPTTLMYQVPPEDERQTPLWQIRQSKLASGREPMAVAGLIYSGLATEANVDMLHFGWARESAREARYRRYMEQDAGEFHILEHLESIMLPPEQIKLDPLAWPEALDKESILAGLA